MAFIILQNSSGSKIRSVEGQSDSWHSLAPPQKPWQWQDGFSAKELAKLWFRNPQLELPSQFRALLESEESLARLEIETGICEAETSIDNFGGRHRHHDQILLGRVGARSVVIGVEAKGIEPFGPIIGEYLADPTKGGKPGSNIPARIELLARSIFDKPTLGVASLRYQLLHAFAGTVIEAKKRSADQAVFMVCEFARKDADREPAERNQRDFAAFLQTFPGYQSLNVPVGKLFGPIHVHGGAFVPTGIPAYIGKVTINLES